jgi:prolyl oligopeptidase
MLNLDADKHTVSYRIVYPHRYNDVVLSGSHAVTLSLLPVDGKPDFTTIEISTKITGDDATAATEPAKDLYTRTAADIASLEAFLGRYGDSLLTGLYLTFGADKAPEWVPADAKPTDYPYTPRRAVIDEYVTTTLHGMDTEQLVEALGGRVPVPVKTLTHREDVTDKPATLESGKLFRNSEISGNIVSDPYRFLEDPDAADTRAWVDSQNALTEEVLGACPSRAAIKEKLLKMYEYARYTQPTIRGDFVYYSKNDGLQDQSIIYQAPLQRDSSGAIVLPTAATEGSARVFLDPAAMDPSGGGKAALGSRGWSHDGKHYAFGVALNGSDWNTIHVMGCEDTVARSPDTKAHPRAAHTAATHSDVLEWVKFSSISWLRDGSGFFYCRYPNPERASTAEFKRGTETQAAAGQTLWFHRRGTMQSSDVCVWAEPQEDSWMCSLEVSECGEMLMLHIANSCDPINKLWVARADQAAAAVAAVDAGQAGTAVAAVRWSRVIDAFEHEFVYVDNTGTQLLLQTNLNAPRGKLVAVDIKQMLDDENIAHTGTLSAAFPEKLPENANFPDFTEIIPEHETGVLSSVCPAGGKLAVVHCIDVLDYLSLYTTDGKALPLDVKAILPACASLGVWGSKDCPVISIGATSPLHPGLAHTMDIGSDAQSVPTLRHALFQESKPAGFVAEDFQVEQQFFNSTDGTRVPMLVMHRRDMPKDGRAPAYIYGYGGFNISLTPSYSASRWLWMQHLGGVAAVVNLRGGGEYGHKWHKQGCLDQKQNVFDDLHSAAGHLISSGYTNAKQTCIHGGSNGGLLVAASSNQQHARLYGAAVAAVGVLDMLCFHRFTIGYAWCSDYGSADHSQEQFDTLAAYSPCLTVPSAPMPALMLTTADHDDRVVPLHSLKYAAHAQRQHLACDAQRPTGDGARPIVIRVEVDAGHGAGKPLSKVMQEQADVFGFFAKYTGAKWTE